MIQFKTIDGLLLRDMVMAGTANLEKNREAVDALNVFPVPDGDTGTNMSLTMQSATREINSKEFLRADEAANALAKGALKGARGNSGVITSQLLHTVQRQVAQSDIQQELESGIDFRQQSFANLLFLIGQFELVEPLLQPENGQFDEVADASSANLHIIRLWLQTCSVAFRTGGLATIAAQHHPVLYLILVVLHHLEEVVDGYAVVLGATLV